MKRPALAETDFPVIDADGHIFDSEQSLRQYLEEPFNRRPRAPLIPLNTWDTTLENRLGLNRITASQWLEALDRGGVSTVILYPTLGLNIGFVQERDLAVAVCRAYNNFLYEEYLRVSPRLRGVAIIPVQDIPEAVKELQRAVDSLGMVAGLLPTHSTVYRPLLGHESYHPLYEEAQRLGCPLALHASVVVPSGPEVEPFEHTIESHTVIHSFGQMRQLTSLVFQGVLDRFPRLRLASLEAGSGWVPYFMQRLDQEYKYRGEVEAPLVARPPSEYIRRGQLYFGFEAEEPLLPHTVDYIGDDHFMYASDYPHWDNEFPDSVREMLDRADLSEQTKKKLMAGNAQRFYGLP